MIKTKYIEISCQTALNKLKRKFPYGWDLNLFRGCSHGCKYCYAIYSHDYLNDGDYFGNVYIKTNIVDVLESELKSKSWKREIINIGGVTDSYQTCEEKYQLMPHILKLLIKYKTPAIILTKSDLVLRDYDLIDELSRITYVNVASTVTTLDDELRKKIEPGSTESMKRIAMLKEFRKTNASIGLHIMPIIPYLTDSYENLKGICEAGADARVHYLLPGTMYLRGKTKKYFLEFIKSAFPENYDNLYNLYKTGSAGKIYKDELYSKLNSIRSKYGLTGEYSKPLKEKMHKEEQLTLEL